MRFERPFEADTYRVSPVMGRREWWVEVRVPSGEEGARYVPPTTFRGRLVHGEPAGPAIWGLERAVDLLAKQTVVSDAWLVVDGELPMTARWALGSCSMFAGFAVWSRTTTLRSARVGLRSRHRRGIEYVRASEYPPSALAASFRRCASSSWSPVYLPEMVQYTRGLAEVGAVSRRRGRRRAPPVESRATWPTTSRSPRSSTRTTCSRAVGTGCAADRRSRVELGAASGPGGEPARALRVAGHELDTVRGFRDKRIMKERVAAAGLRFPRSRRVRTESATPGRRRGIGYPLNP